MVIVEKLVEWRLAGETEVLGENLPQLHFVHYKSHMTSSNPGRRDGKPATNRLSYGAAFVTNTSISLLNRLSISVIIIYFLYLLFFKEPG
jgi:hypothetical protein